MRSFVAIGMPDDVAETLWRVTRGLKAGRRVEPDAMHLTLAFLGDVAVQDLEDLNDGLEAMRVGSFEVRLLGLGTFGPGPRTLWAGVAASPELSAVQKKVLSVARAAGVIVERRRFVPHVTLARFREGEGGAVGDVLTQAGAFGLSPFRVEQVTLYASHLSPSGARYEVLAEYPLLG
mgnify:CR=1 FL=1